MHELKIIPDELKKRDQWVNWKRFKKSSGAVSKLPINSMTGRYASVVDPSSWSSFANAIQRAQTDPCIDGLGFVFIATDPYTGIDFDHCRNPISGEFDPDVLSLIQFLDSYTEISISGTGVHVIIRGELSEPGCRKNGAEIYDRARYFIVTGDHIPGYPTTINERQPQLEKLHQKLFPPQPIVQHHLNAKRTLADNDLTERIKRSRQGHKFRQLFSGDWSSYPSQSESDLALCSILGFWSQDRAQIDRIFRSSGLYRKKWDEPRNRSGATYGEITIQKVLGNTQ